MAGPDSVDGDRAEDCPDLEQALSALRPKLVRWVELRMGARVRRELDADGVVQEVMIAAVVAGSSAPWHDTRQLQRWGRTVAARVIWRVARSAGAQRRGGSSVEEIEPRSVDPSPELSATAAELDKRFAADIAALPDRFRRVVELRAAKPEVSWSEIAVQLGCVSGGAARKVHGRAEVSLARRARR